MRLLLLFTSVMLIFPGGQIAALAAEPRLDEDRQRMVSLARKLGDTKFLARESAGKQLVEFGERALPAIRHVAANSKNPELHYRARYVIRRIMFACRKSKSTGLEMVVIEAGEFQMGSSLKEPGHRVDEILHRVRISEPFLLGEHEVTQGQFQEVMEFAPSHFMSESDGKEKVLRLDTGEFPVERVTWFDAVAFCNRLSKRDGYKPYYKMANVQRDGESVERADLAIEGGNGYRLPTEAEWEYACRASTTQRFHFGTSVSGRKANCVSRSVVLYGSAGKEKSLGRTTKVGSYKPNAFGLYDMHGNVAEWCWDWYTKDYYARSLPEDPVGPDRGHHRVLRGGSWLVNELSCRSASRFYLTADQRKYFAGFRVARTP